MAKRNRHTTKPNSTIPKSGYGFLEVLLSTLKGHSATLALELEKNHKKRGRKGYPALGKLCALTLQYLFNERYSSYFLADLDSDSRLLSMCGLDKAPSEPTFSRFKKQLSGCLPLLAQILNKVVEECASEIERLRDAGVIAKDAPPLGQMLAMDATDIEAYAKPISEHCDDPEQGTCTKKHKYHCDSPVPQQCTKHSEKPCADPDARWGYRTPKRRWPGSATSNGDEESKELFFGYKAHAVADAYYQLPLHVTLRPANQNEGPYFGEDLGAALARHQRLKPKPESTDGRREGRANWDEGAYKGESLGSIGTDVTPQMVFSSRTGPRERSMEAGNRVIVRPDATGCTRGPGGREFGCGGSVADSAVRLGVGWLAVGPGREWSAQPRASPGEDAK